MQHSYGEVSAQRESSLHVQTKRVLPIAVFACRSGSFDVIFIIARGAGMSLLENDGVDRNDSQLTLAPIGST